MRLWNVNTGRCLQILQGHTDWAYTVAFHPQGDIVASGSADCTIKLWNWHTGQCLQTFTGHRDKIFAIAFSPDGKIFASASADQTVRLWNCETGLVQTLEAHDARIYAAIFSPNPSPPLTRGATPVGRFPTLRSHCVAGVPPVVASGVGVAWVGGRTNTHKSRNPSQNERAYCEDSQYYCVHTARFENPYPKSGWQGNKPKGLRADCGFFPRGFLATCSTDQTIKLWDWQTGKCLRTLIGHTNWVFSIAYSPDGQILASASHDQTVRIWDVKTGECRHICVGHTHLVSAVAFSPDGQFVASGSQDQTVRVWDVKTGECIRMLRAKRLYEGMNITGMKGLTEATILTLQALGAVVE